MYEGGSMLSDNTDTTWIDILLHRAIAINASDLHLEPKGAYAVLRQRIHGLLQPVKTLSLWQYYQMVTRFKVLAHLDIAEHRLPQEGRFSTVFKRDSYDIRLSVFPTLHGEKLALRIIDTQHIQLPLDHLGFTADQLRQYQQQLQQSQGLILVTGPTGSGKTVTLYASLLALDNSILNISTLEDPVEYNIESFNQSTIHKNIGFDFANALTALLRQDPDVILIGEIRDLATAQIALRAAQTGHLVLASLHCSDCVSAISRLNQLGIAQDTLINTVDLVLAQRLVRIQCYQCNTKPNNNEDCKHCVQGFSHRQAIYESIIFHDDLRSRLRSENHPTAIQALLKKHLTSSLWDSGLQLVNQNKTTMDELKRVIRHV